MPEQNRKTKAHCNDCSHETTHTVIATDTKEMNNEDFWGRTTHEFLKCDGCGNTTMRSLSQCSEDQGISIVYYPPAVSRKLPSWLYSSMMPLFNDSLNEIIALLREVYSALYAGNNRLALMGTRSICDVALCDKLGGDVGTFDQKLEAAEKSGLLTKQTKGILSSAIDAGSAAAHRAYNPTTETLEHVLDIVEHMLKEIYILEGLADYLARTTPPRPPRTKPSNPVQATVQSNPPSTNP